MKNSVRNKLIKIVKDVEPVGGSRHAAAIHKKGRIFSYGINREYPSTFLTQFGMPEWMLPYLHAEQDAIREFTLKYPYSDLKNMELSVIRWSDGLANSRPCSYCNKIITKLGIKNINYST